MSANAIARWNAIPLERPNDADAGSTTLKRGRPEDDGGLANNDDDDDVSLVSRSPSPRPHDSMDVDESYLHKYDEYVRGPVREVITVETKIKPSNKGFALLSKFGWVEGQPVGLSGDGRTEPIPFHIKSDLTGLGKTSQDVRMIEETVSQRRGLDSERQQKESEEQRKLREDSVARKTALESEITSTLRAFYCTLCDKQFKNVAQYDEHTNSYAHHHKARFKDMQASARLKPKEEVDKRKEKERKREEKELRKIAAANGIKMPKPAAIPNPSIALASTLPADITNSNNSAATANMEIDGVPIPTDSKRLNWSSISGDSHHSAQGDGSGGGFNKSGWASLGPSSNSSPAAPNNSRFGPPISSGSSSRTSATSAGEPTTQTSNRSSHIPTFRNAGWTSLDTGSSQPPPPPPPISRQAYEHPPPPPPLEAPPAPPQLGGWSNTSSLSAGLGSSSRQWQSSFASPPPPSNSFAPPPPPPEPSFLPSAPTPPPSHPAPAPPPPEPKPVRSSWQQFQKKGGRK
ncbi:hypothetical protein CVT25_014959 [Psilocybe cyanescens]|uniref:G-patch domain-containing protein n=1 Tax=Psilocybe cyanescens TaxID=93625 RepID=A0A409XI88_PSICY|nr:hypothetical protein CVT25_014959 [Psilocybe cyanescens]